MQRERGAFGNLDKGLVGRDPALEFLEGETETHEFLEILL